MNSTFEPSLTSRLRALLLRIGIEPIDAVDTWARARRELAERDIRVDRRDYAGIVLALEHALSRAA